jgi:nitrile hydratase accessory protein
MIQGLEAAELRELAVPQSDSVPVFAAPWEASAFAMVVALHRAGRFEWREWVAVLAEEIRTAPPDPTGALYYERWSAALEKLLGRLGLMSPAAIAERTEAWRKAYLATPHGAEVRLDAATATCTVDGAKAVA